jgi:hypothetical protein
VILFCVAVCALVGAVTLTAVVLTDDGPDRCCPAVQNAAAETKPSPTTRPPATRPAGLPQCLVGSWRTVDEVLMIKFYTNQPTMAFTGGGRQYEFRPDGTGTERYDNVAFTAPFRGRELRIVGNGTLEFTWKADDKKVTYIARTGAQFAWSYYDQRGLISTQPIAPTDPNLNEVDDYTCQGTQAVESNSTGYRSAWARTTGFGMYG